MAELGCLPGLIFCSFRRMSPVSLAFGVFLVETITFLGGFNIACQILDPHHRVGLDVGSYLSPPCDP